MQLASGVSQLAVDVAAAQAEAAAKAASVPRNIFTAAGQVAISTAAGRVTVLQHNLAATTAPTVNDDLTAGYAIGSRWIDTVAKKEYVCMDPAEGAADWDETTYTAPAGIGGSTGSVDNAILAADGTGGATLKATDLVVETATATQANVAIRNVHSEANSALVLTPNGTGALIAGPKPDGVAAVGGNARGARAVDLQMARTAATQVASGEEAVIAGGSNNTASGTLSAVGGGNSNQATGTAAAVLSGLDNQATGAQYPFIGGGTNNRCTASRGVILAGRSMTASAEQATALAGYLGVASGAYSLVHGLYPVASLYNQFAMASGRFAAAGDAQRFWLQLMIATASTDAAILTLTGAAPGTGTRPVVTAERTWFCSVLIVARQDDGKSGYAERRVCIERTANLTELVGSVQTIGTDFWDAELGTPTIAITADDTNEALQLEVTPANATATRWVAVIHAAEVGF